MSKEMLQPAFLGRSTPSISYGLPFHETCLKHVSGTFDAHRVFVLFSGSLAKNTDCGALERIMEKLGAKLVGIRVGMQPHTLFVEVLEVVDRCRALNVDLIITVGGGTLADAAKLASFALANDVRTRADLRNLPYMSPLPQRRDAKPSVIPIISVPTTLSGAEYTYFAGSTDDTTRVKYQFIPPLKGPSLVILDAELSLTTPISFWLSTGIRGVDHCVEVLCSLGSDQQSDAAAAKSLLPLVLGLLWTKKDPQDVRARHFCQLGLSGAMTFLTRPIAIFPLGASHGIGHMLGPMGVGHGETSCILLPAVCKYNAAKNANVARQKGVSDILWANADLQSMFNSRSLSKEGEGAADLGDLLDVIIRELGMPRKLSEVNIGRDRFDLLAENSLRDPFLATNPVPLTEKWQVMEILDMVE